jgi:hypothetical protein
MLFSDVIVMLSSLATNCNGLANCGRYCCYCLDLEMFISLLISPLIPPLDGNMSEGIFPA